MPPHEAYKIEGPALISFSGGRTSGYMLHEVVRAYSGTLPGNIHVVFSNTGKEREETLRFVHECATQWTVHVNWLEYRQGEQRFAEVDYGSASRNGEPFAALIAKKKRTPNWQERWCTAYLKVQPMIDFMASMGLGPGEYYEAIGLRHDEGMRIFKAMERGEKNKRNQIFPLARARVTKADVMAFWKAQPFDLGLQSYEGNCDLCFMKGRALKKRIIRDNPAIAEWWIAAEDQYGRFDRRDSIAMLVDEVTRSPELFDFANEEHEVECGLLCGTDHAAA